MKKFFPKPSLLACLGLAVSLSSGAAIAEDSIRAQVYKAPEFVEVIEAAKKRQANSVATTGIEVLPIDQAKFLRGQHFDFEVEVLDKSEKNTKITINDKDIEEFFDTKLTRTVHEDYISYRLNDLQFTETGSLNVVIESEVDGDTRKREINYEVVDPKSENRAKNVILFAGDGMSLQVKQAARILSKGIYEGKYNDLLAMENLENLALITTSGYDSIVTDSANSASAYNTGHKSVVNAMGVYGNRTADTLDDPKVENINEIIQRTRGMSVGVVTTSSVTDATPASTSAHTRRRADQDYIAHNFLNESVRPEVLLGGGARYFLPLSQPGSRRTDEIDVIKQFEDLGYQFAGNRKELLETSDDKPLLGLFAMNNMDVYMDREHIPNPEVVGDFNDQPNLVEMTAKALDILSKNDDGFFLLAEAASIDKQLHTMDWHRAVYDTIEFDQAIAYAKNWAEENGNDTLIIVVADHSHGVSITGTYSEEDGGVGREAVRTYGDAKWPNFVDEDGDGFPDNPDPSITLAMQYANFPDHYENYRFLKNPVVPGLADADGKVFANEARKGHDDARMVEGNLPQYKETQEVHSADDIVLMAGGPGSEYFRGVMDNTEVFYGIMQALHIDAVEDKADK